MKILGLSSWFPFPADNGSRLRISSLLQSLAREHEVQLITLEPEEPGEEGIRVLEGLGIQHQWLAVPPYRPGSIAALAGFFSLRPRSVVSTHRWEIEDRIGRKLRGGGYDLAVAFQMRAAAYLGRLDRVPALLEEIECGVFANRAGQASSSLSRVRSGMTNFKLKRYMRRLLRGFSACTVVSQQERAILQEWVPDSPKIRVIPNCLRLRDYQPVQSHTREAAAIFPGSVSHAPNLEGMRWFQSEVLPAVSGLVKGFQVYVTGGGASGGAFQPPIFRTGYLDRSQLHALFGRVQLCVVPLLEGGGTRLKILEAMALGVPVVSTPLGAQGLDVEDGIHLCLAETPRDFSGAVVRLLSDPDLRHRLSGAARDYVSRHHDCRSVIPAFLSLVNAVGGRS